MSDRELIKTRVRIDDFGPFDCKLDPDHTWNGLLSPYFTLDTTRELSAQTLRRAEDHINFDTVHVIDGFEDSRDTVHIIEGHPFRNGRPRAVAFSIRWRSVGRNQDAVSFAGATPKSRKAARRSKVTGRGARRTVIIHIDWLHLYEGGELAVQVVQPSPEGLYGIGGWEWAWDYDGWWCACGTDWLWHETACKVCGRSRDPQPEEEPGDCDCGCGALREGARKAGDILRELVPTATAAGLIVEDGHPRLISVATDSEIVWTENDQDRGPFDYERIGGADAALHQALRAVTDPEAFWEAGWIPLENDQIKAYAIKFPPPLPKQ
ncbi:hypothetical protein ACFXJ6_07995 [Streptomyces sp. NPDC059218]|uniref:hypothetical protein n=1 Tax=unclassified Streptomyces TaxID=2593676 RepID=UPI0036982CA8